MMPFDAYRREEHKAALQVYVEAIASIRERRALLYIDELEATEALMKVLNASDPKAMHKSFNCSIPS